MNYKVVELLESAFGVKQPIYMVNMPEMRNPNLIYEGIEMLPENVDLESTSWMGTPIIYGATFIGENYKQYNAKGEIVRVSLNDYALPPATMFSFRRAKNITRTNLLGSNGTVKEIYGFDDWVIDVKGIALDEPNRSAMQQIEELLTWERLADSIKISGKLFNQHKIDRVVMADWSDDVNQGKSGVISFQFQLYSDEAIELIL